MIVAELGMDMRVFDDADECPVGRAWVRPTGRVMEPYLVPAWPCSNSSLVEVPPRRIS